MKSEVILREISIYLVYIFESTVLFYIQLT